MFFTALDFQHAFVDGTIEVGLCRKLNNTMSDHHWVLLIRFLPVVEGDWRRKLTKRYDSTARVPAFEIALSGPID